MVDDPMATAPAPERPPSRATLEAMAAELRRWGWSVYAPGRVQELVAVHLIPCDPLAPAAADEYWQRAALRSLGVRLGDELVKGAVERGGYEKRPAAQEEVYQHSVRVGVVFPQPGESLRTGGAARYAPRSWPPPPGEGGS